MLNIPYDATDFPSSMPTLRGRHALAADWNDLIWSAVSVGKGGFDDMLAHGDYSFDEIRFRNYIIWANLFQSSGYVYRSPAYDDLDPTEKGAISYFLGMAIAKLFAFKLFSAPWMVHLDRLVDRYSVGLRGRSRPDLAGQDYNGRWILMEAKGRTGKFNSAALEKAKLQVRRVREIDGQRPHLRVGAEMYFEDYMNISLVDPEDFTPDAVDLKIGSSALDAVYYRRFMPLLRARRRLQVIRGAEYAFADYEELGVSIGVLTELQSFIEKHAVVKHLQSMEYQAEKGWQGRSGPWRFRTYPDGLAVGVDKRWSEELMSRVPFDR